MSFPISPVFFPRGEKQGTKLWPKPSTQSAKALQMPPAHPPQSYHQHPKLTQIETRRRIICGDGVGTPTHKRTSPTNSILKPPQSNPLFSKTSPTQLPQPSSVSATPTRLPPKPPNSLPQNKRKPTANSTLK